MLIILYVIIIQNIFLNMCKLLSYCLWKDEVSLSSKYQYIYVYVYLIILKYVRDTSNHKIIEYLIGRRTSDVTSDIRYLVRYRISDVTSEKAIRIRYPPFSGYPIRFRKFSKKKSVGKNCNFATLYNYSIMNMHTYF